MRPQQSVKTAPNANVDRHEPKNANEPASVQARTAACRDLANTETQMLRQEGGDRPDALTNLVPLRFSFGESLVKMVRANHLRERRGPTERETSQSQVPLACSLVNGGCLDLSRLSLAEQIELNSFVGWSVLYSAAESLGGAIDTLRLPPAVVSCMLESIEAPDYRKSGCAGRRLLRSKPWICLIPGTDSARLSRRLWNEALSYIPSGSWIEYGPADARERLQVAAVDQFDLRENEFIGLARARERLQAGDVDGARLDVLSVGQWKQLGRDSSATFKCLMAMEMTSGNEEKFFELLSCLPNDESWPELDGPCRAAWVEGCEKAASSFELWREFIGTPLAWKRWDERSQLLRKLLGRHSRGDTRNPDKRELQSIGPLVPLRNTSPTVDAIAKRKEDVDKAAKSQHEWRGNLLALCQGDPVDVQALMTLLDELAESPHLPNGRKRDLLQEEFGGQTLLEHVGDGNVEALMELMARLQ